MEENRGKRNGKWKFIFLLMGILLGCLVLVAVILFYRSDMRKGMEVSRLLREYNEESELAMNLEIVADIGGEQIDTDAQIIRTEMEDKVVSCVKSHGITLCYYDGALFLENGKAYTISELFPDYSKLLGLTTVLYETVDITEAKHNQEKIYGITLDKERAGQLTELLLPSLQKHLLEIPDVHVDVSAREGELTAILFEIVAKLQDAEKTQITVDAKLTVQEAEDTEEFIPEIVREVIATENYEVSGAFTGDIVRLFSGWMNMQNKGTLSADLSIRAACGPFQVDETLQMFRVTKNGTQIHCMRKKDNTLYFTDNAICDENGNGIEAAEENMINAGQIPAIIYVLCLNGSFECVEANGEYTYTFALDEEGMRAIAYGVAPELENMDIKYEVGSIQIVMAEENIKKIHLMCGGSIAILGVNTPVSIEGEIIYSQWKGQEEIVIPQVVLETLIK